MVWLKSSESRLLKTFCGLKIGWILRELWAKMCVYVLFPSLTSLTYIALQPLCVFDLYSTSSTCFNIDSIWRYGWKALSLSFSKLFADKIGWILRKLWAKMCVYVLFPSLTFALHYMYLIYLTPRHCFDLLCKSISTPPTSNNMYWHVPFNVHTKDKLTMGVNEWLPHYLIRSRSHSNSKGLIKQSSNLKF